MTTEAQDFIRLHVARLGGDGRPALSERFIRYLDRPERQRAVTQARERLAREHPQLAAVLTLCVDQGLTQRAAATALGISQALVCRRRHKAEALLARWCTASADGRDPEGQAA